MSDSKGRLKKGLFLLILIAIPILIVATEPVPTYTSNQKIQQVTTFMKPAYTNLQMTRHGDKLNITFGAQYVTLRGYFYYEGDTYSFSEAASFGVTYDSWVDYNTGTVSKFGGLIDTSDVAQGILDNGYYVAFELVDRSDGTKIRKVGDSIYLSNNVRIVWKDYENPTNKFNVFNKTVVYLTDEGSKFHGSLVYDPVVEIGNVSVGVYNQTFLNKTVGGIQVNDSFTQGDYQSEVFRLNDSVTKVNLTTFATITDGFGINASIREYNLSNNFTDNLAFWMGFDDSTNVSLLAIGNISGIDESISGGWSITAGDSCKEESCMLSDGIDSESKSKVEFNGIQNFTQMTILFHTNVFSKIFAMREPISFKVGSQAPVIQYHSANQVKCNLNGQTSGNFGTYVLNEIRQIGCWFNGTHHAAINNGLRATTPVLTNGGEPYSISFADVFLLAFDVNVQHWNGTLDNIMFFDRALTDGEILELNSSYPRWQPFKEFQPLANEEDLNNFSISANNTFIQAKFEMFADGTASPTLHNFSISYPPTLTISSATITPSRAFTTNDLNCSAIPDSTISGDLTVQFEWYNNTNRSNGANSNVTCQSQSTCYASKLFTSGNFSHHGNVTCSARAVFEGDSTSWLNITRFISNSLPVFDADALVILPVTPGDAVDLSCNWTTDEIHDLDNDTLTFSYGWAKSTNGVDFTWQGFDDISLGLTNTTTDDFWKCTSYPSDDWNISSNVTSPTVQIGSSNVAPVINTVNVTTNRVISDSTNPTNNNSYIAIGINWTDADGDNATIYACKTNSFVGTNCEDGSWGTTHINISNSTFLINHSVGNFTSQDNTLYVFAFSNNSLTSSSKSATFEINFPPVAPTLSSPANLTEFASTVNSATIGWAASTDSNSDSIRYIAYGGGIINPDINLTNTSSLSFLWPSLGGGIHYWKVQPIDEHGYGGQNSTIFSFSIAEPPGGPGDGGGPSVQPIDEAELLQAAREGLCGNKACEEGENLFNCPQDCAPGIGFDLDDIINCLNADKFDRCVFKEDGFVAMLFFLIIGIIIIGVVMSRKGDKKSKRKSS